MEPARAVRYPTHDGEAVMDGAPGKNKDNSNNRSRSSARAKDDKILGSNAIFPTKMALRRIFLFSESSDPQQQERCSTFAARSTLLRSAPA